MTDRNTNTNDQRAGGPCAPPPIGEITSAGTRTTVRGCALQLALWIARRQGRINDALDGGQLILNWKGVSSPSISGEIKTRL